MFVWTGGGLRPVAARAVAPFDRPLKRPGALGADGVRQLRLLRQLRRDTAIAGAGTLFSAPNRFGVACNAPVIASILTHVAPALGWR